MTMQMSARLSLYGTTSTAIVHHYVWYGVRLLGSVVSTTPKLDKHREVHSPEGVTWHISQCLSLCTEAHSSEGSINMSFTVFFITTYLLRKV